MRGAISGPPGSPLQQVAFWRYRGWNSALQKPQQQNAAGAWLGWGPGRLLASLWDDRVGHLANVTAGHHLVFNQTHFRKHKLLLFFTGIKVRI